MYKTLGIVAGILVLAGVIFWYAAKPAGELRQDDDAGDLIVFAASSIAWVLHENEALIENRTGQDIVIVEAASSTLARQITEGAPADVFITADAAWLDYLADAGHFEGAPIEIARNRLVLVFSRPVINFCQVQFFAPPSAPDLLGACPYSGPVASGDPGYVPLGKYASQTIEFYNWSINLVPALDARAALALLTGGATGAALLYQTDVLNLGNTWPRFEIPEESHSPILYWASAVKQSDADATDNFLIFLQSDAFKTILKARGFEVD